MLRLSFALALSVIFGAFSGLFYSIFQAYEKMEGGFEGLSNRRSLFNHKSKRYKIGI